MVIKTDERRSMAELERSLDRGYTLPAEWYTSAEFYEQEKKRIFGRFWQYAGHLGQVAKVGDFFTCTLGDVPVVVVRDQEGELRAFANVCRHRGSTLVLEDHGSRKTIQCHYHGWTWNLDGTLRTAPRWNESDYDKDDFPLHALKLETWGPMIFVNPDRSAGPLSTILGELPRILAGTGLQMDPLRHYERRTYDIAANWKIVAENFNECYHCPVAHPTFSDLIDIDTYKVVTEYEWFSTQHGAVREEARDGRVYDVSDDILKAGVKEGCFSLIFPTTMLATNPGPHNLLVLSMFPVDAHRTIEHFDFFFTEGVADAEVRPIIEFVEQVQQEDIILCESVQRGMRSGFFDQGRLMVSRENGIQHFQKLVYRVMA
jgi:choline monooxygenase